MTRWATNHSANRSNPTPRLTASSSATGAFRSVTAILPRTVRVTNLLSCVVANPLVE
jgi:hypothetical protein